MEEDGTKETEEQSDAKDGGTEEVDWPEAAERVRETCRKYAYFLTGNPDDAEDIAGTAVEKTWRKHIRYPQAFSTMGAFIEFARCCVLTGVIDGGRQEELTQKYLRDHIGESHTTLTPEDIAIVDDARVHWEKMIELLEPRKKKLLELKQEGLSWEQIRTITGHQTVSAAKGMYYRTLKVLRQGSREYCPDL